MQLSKKYSMLGVYAAMCAAILPLRGNARECPIPTTTTTISNNQYRAVSYAYSLTESQYQQLKKSAGVSAMYQGIPLGANYGEYKNSVASRAEEIQYSNYENLSYAYATTGMSSNDLEAYKECLRDNAGLTLLAERIGSDSYTISVLFSPVTDAAALKGALGSMANLTQETAAAVKDQLAAANFQGKVDMQVKLVPSDPKKEASIQVRVGSSASRVLDLPAIIPPPPPPPPALPQQIFELDKIQTNVAKGSFGHYGKVIFNGQDGPRLNKLSFMAKSQRPSKYELHVKYATGANRKLSVFVNGQEVSGSPFDVKVTGPERIESYFYDKQTENLVCTITLVAGDNEIEISNPSAFPHISRIRLKPI